jgi:hypothetical protein
LEFVSVQVGGPIPAGLPTAVLIGVGSASTSVEVYRSRVNGQREPGRAKRDVEERQRRLENAEGGLVAEQRESVVLPLQHQLADNELAIVRVRFAPLAL